MALKYFEPQNRPANYGTQGGSVKDYFTLPNSSPSNSVFGPAMTYTTTYRQGANGMVTPIKTPNEEPKGFYRQNSKNPDAPPTWVSFEEQAKQNQERSKFNQAMAKEQNEAAEAKFKAGQELDSRGFSRNFLEYLQGARERKLSQASADIEKTGAETGLTQAQTGLASAQSSRISQMTPFEIQQMIAQSNLFGAQARKLGAETASELGRTAPSMTAMALQQAQARLMGAQTASELGLTAPSQANMYATMAQASKLGEGQYFSRFVPPFMGGISPYGSGIDQTSGYQSVLSPPTKKKLSNYRATY